MAKRSRRKRQTKGGKGTHSVTENNENLDSDETAGGPCLPQDGMTTAFDDSAEIQSDETSDDLRTPSKRRKCNKIVSSSDEERSEEGNISSKDIVPIDSNRTQEDCSSEDTKSDEDDGLVRPRRRRNKSTIMSDEETSASRNGSLENDVSSSDLRKGLCLDAEACTSGFSKKDDGDDVVRSKHRRNKWRISSDEEISDMEIRSEEYDSRNVNQEEDSSKKIEPCNNEFCDNDDDDDDCVKKSTHHRINFKILSDEESSDIGNIRQENNATNVNQKEDLSKKVEHFTAECSDSDDNECVTKSASKRNKFKISSDSDEEILDIGNKAQENNSTKNKHVDGLRYKVEPNTREPRISSDEVSSNKCNTRGDFETPSTKGACKKTKLFDKETKTDDSIIRKRNSKRLKAKAKKQGKKDQYYSSDDNDDDRKSSQKRNELFLDEDIFDTCSESDSNSENKITKTKLEIFPKSKDRNRDLEATTNKGHDRNFQTPSSDKKFFETKLFDEEKNGTKVGTRSSKRLKTINKNRGRLKTQDSNSDDSDFVENFSNGSNCEIGDRDFMESDCESDEKTIKRAKTLRVSPEKVSPIKDNVLGDFKTPSSKQEHKKTKFLDKGTYLGDSGKRSSERLRAKTRKRGKMKVPDRKERLELTSPDNVNLSFESEKKKKRRVNNFIKERNSYNQDKFETFLSEEEISDFIDDEECDIEIEEEEKKRKRKKRRKKKPKHQKRIFESSTEEDLSEEDETLNEVSPIPSTEDEGNIKCDEESRRAIPRRQNKHKELVQKRLAQLKKSRNLVKVSLDKRKSLLQNFNDEVMNPSVSDVEDLEIEEIQNHVIRDSDVEFVVSEIDTDEDDMLWTAKTEAFFEKLTDTESDDSQSDSKDFKSEDSGIVKHGGRKRKSKFKKVIVLSDSEDEQQDEIVVNFFKIIKEIPNNLSAVESAIKTNNELLSSFDKDGKRPLHLAASLGDVKLINLLLDYGVPVNLLDGNNMLAVGYAAYFKQPEALKILLERTDLKLMIKTIRKYSQHMSLLHLILLTGRRNRFINVKDRQIECLKVVREFDGKIYKNMLKVCDEGKRTPVLLTIEEGNAQCLGELSVGDCPKELCAANCELDHPLWLQDNILHYAVASASNCTEDDDAACLRVLMDRFNFDINKTDRNGFTPLMCAAELGNTDCIKLLCEKGAKLMAKDKQGTTALHLAAATGNTECVEMLIDYGHQPDCLDDYGWPPLLYANFRSSESCVVALMQANPRQLFILSDLIKRKDKEQREKNIKVVRSTLESLSHQDAYYKIFNDFIRQNPNLLDDFNHGLFLKIWKNILDFDNKYSWFKRRVKKMKPESYFVNHVVVRRDAVLESAMNYLRKLEKIDFSSMSVTFDRERGTCLGPKKEFLACFCCDILKPERKLFEITDDQQYSLTPLYYFADLIIKDAEEKIKKIQSESSVCKAYSSESKDLQNGASLSGQSVVVADGSPSSENGAGTDGTSSADDTSSVDGTSSADTSSVDGSSSGPSSSCENEATTRGTSSSGGTSSVDTTSVDDTSSGQSVTAADRASSSENEVPADGTFSGLSATAADGASCNENLVTTGGASSVDGTLSVDNTATDGASSSENEAATDGTSFADNTYSVDGTLLADNTSTSGQNVTATTDCGASSSGQSVAAADGASSSENVLATGDTSSADHTSPVVRSSSGQSLAAVDGASSGQCVVLTDSTSAPAGQNIGETDDTSDVSNLSNWSGISIVVELMESQPDHVENNDQQPTNVQKLKDFAEQVEEDLEDKLDEIEFIGRFVAACIASGFHLNLHLTQSLIKEILNLPLNHPDDLKSFDNQLYNGAVTWVLNNEVDGMELPFSISCKNPWDASRIEEVPLSTEDTVVTDENKEKYVQLVSKFKLEASRRDEVTCFKIGFYRELNEDLISLFTPDEFSLVMNGVQSIDVSDWKANTRYSHWSENDEIIKWFWKTVEKLKEEEKALLLQFSTGSPCVPVGGFKDLEGLSGKTKFTIAKGTGHNRIPTASTCFNRLSLGHYDSEKNLREKVLVALRHGSEGFEFL